MKSIRNKVIAIVFLFICIVIGIIFLFMNKPKKEEVIVASVEPTVDVIETPTVESTIEPTPVPIDTTSENSINKIVNRDNKVSEAYVPELVALNVTNENNQQLRPEAAGALEEMFNAASEAGYSLNVVSGYRSYKQQQSLWYTYEEKYGRKYANRMDSIPGASEHQLGLAVDLSANVGCKLRQCFANTAPGKWLAENSYKYGFILRYPENKESITGVMFNPWHFRYIGKEEAAKVFASGQVLEEYYGY